MVENFVGKWEVVEVLGLDDFTKAMSNPDDEILLKVPNNFNILILN
jgi:hypothetical protein